MQHLQWNKTYFVNKLQIKFYMCIGLCGCGQCAIIGVQEGSKNLGSRGLLSLAQARLSHAEERVWSNSYTYFVLLSKQQRTLRIKNCVTIRHDSVEIVQAKRWLKIS